MVHSGAWATILLLVLSLFAPPAAAAIPALGDFLSETGVRIEGASHVQVTPLAFLLADDNGLESFEASQERGTVCVHERRVIEVDVAGQTFRTIVPPEDYCAERTSLQIVAMQRKTADGWLGVFPNRSATLTLAQPTLAFESRDESLVASKGARSATSADGNNPTVSWYAKRVIGGHLFMSSPGAVTFEGDGLLKLSGPTVRIVSREGTSEYVTGQETNETASGRESVLRWISVYLDESHLRLQSNTAFQLAAGHASRVAWDGKLSFIPTEGALVTPAFEYPASGESADVVGRFQATLEPASGGRLIHVTGMEGELRSTSLKAQPRPVPAGVEGVGIPWTFLLLGAAVLTGGGAAVVILKRKRDRERRATSDSAGLNPVQSPEIDAELLHSADLDQLLRAARQAAPRNPAAAEAFLERAVEIQPEDRLAWLDLGYARFHQGKLEAALRAFDEASAGKPRDEAEAMAAACLVRLGKRERAEYRLAQALRERDLSLDVVCIIRSDAELLSLIKGRPGLKSLWNEATRRLFTGWQR